VPAEGLAPLPSGWSVPRLLSSFGAGFVEAEVVDEGCSCVVVSGDGDDLVDRISDPGIAGGARQTGEDERESDRNADWVPVTVEDCDRQVADVRIDTGDRASPQLVEGGDRLSIETPGGVDVPAVLGRVVGASAVANPFVRGERRIVAIDRPGADAGIGAPEEDRVVAGSADEPRHVGEPGVERGAVVERSVVLEVRAGMEAGTRGSARSRIGPVVGEAGTRRRRSVQGWRLQYRVAGRRQATASPLVDGDEEDVRVHCGTVVSPARRARS
jgi:hypothetical protein